MEAPLFQFHVIKMANIKWIWNQMCDVCGETQIASSPAYLINLFITDYIKFYWNRLFAYRSELE